MEVVSRRQARLMGIMLALDGMMVTLSHVFKLAERDAWMAHLLAFPVILILLWMLTSITARFPGKSLFQIMVLRRPVIGRILALPVLLFIFLVILRDIRALSEFVNIELLAYTPVPVISGLIVVSIVVMVNSRFEVIARMVEIWLPLLLAFIAIIPILLYPEFELRHTLPLLEKGLVPALRGSWYTIAAMGQILLLPFLLPSGEFGLRDGLYSMVVTAILVQWLNLCVLLSIGSAIASKLQFPFHEMVRLIRVTDFLDRFELPLDMIYIPLMITKMAFFLYAFMYGVERIVPALHMDKLLLSFGACCFSFSFWFFRNASQLFNFTRSLSVLAWLLEVVMTGLLIALLRPKQQQDKPPKSRAPDKA